MVFIVDLATLPSSIASGKPISGMRWHCEIYLLLKTYIGDIERVCNASPSGLDLKGP